MAVLQNWLLLYGMLGYNRIFQILHFGKISGSRYLLVLSNQERDLALDGRLSNRRGLPRFLQILKLAVIILLLFLQRFLLFELAPRSCFDAGPHIASFLPLGPFIGLQPLGLYRLLYCRLRNTCISLTWT